MRDEKMAVCMWVTVVFTSPFWHLSVRNLHAAFVKHPCVTRHVVYQSLSALLLCIHR